MFDKVYLRKILDLPSVYAKFQEVIAKNDYRKWMLNQYIGTTENKRILDLGCGTADILDYFDNAKQYVGIDINEKYITDNRKRFANRKECSFFCGDLNAYLEKEDQSFDLVLMMGVMHHISDEEVEKTMISVKRIISEGGVFVSDDCCYTKGMSIIARLLCMMDRGRYVRYADEYVRMQNKYWNNVKYDICTDTLRFLPYSLIIFTNSDRS